MRARTAFSRVGRIATLAVVAVIAPTVAGSTRPARADIVAAYLQGHGGFSSPHAEDSAATASAGSSSGLGVQAGLRLLIFEAYADHTSLGSGSSLTRGILGLRGAIGLGTWRLILRGGGGVISERGGALTGGLDGAPDRTGVVARAGAALEKKLARTLHAGFGVEGEVFDLITGQEIGGTGAATQITGSDVFVTLHLKFEIGI